MTKITLHHKTFGKLSQNENITENGIYVYLCLKPFAVSSNWTYLYTDVVKLNSVLSDVDINNKRQKDCIKTGLNELEQAGFIKIISNNKYDYKLDLEGMIEPYDKNNHNPYTVYEADAFKQTLKDCGNNKIILKQLSDFFYRLTHNEVSVDMDSMEMYYFNAERESIAESCGIDVRSVDKYNDILVKNNLIYIYKYNYKYRDSGKQLTNAYGLPRNKDKIDGYCNDYLNEHKDEVYLSIIPRGKGSKKLMEEEKKAQYSPVEEATDEELAEHDKRHKALYAKRMAKKMEKEKPVVAESAPIEEVEEVVQADSKEETVKADDNEVIDYDAIIAERKAKTNAILSDSNKEETDFDATTTESEWNYSFSDSNKEVKTDDDFDTIDEEYYLNISSRDKAIELYKAQLEDDDPFDIDDVQPKLIAEFADKWDNEHSKKEKEYNPFDDDEEDDGFEDDEEDDDNPFA